MTTATSAQAQPGSIASQTAQQILDDTRVLAVSVIGGHGCGKTALIEATLRRLRGDIKVGVIACDLVSHRDADRLAHLGHQVVQINTGLGGELGDGALLGALREMNLNSVDLLLIEHLGSLIVPSLRHLGQHVKVAMFSVAAGDDKADKHPNLVKDANAIVLNKIDLMGVAPFNRDAFFRDVRRLNPDVPIFELSTLRGEGIDAWVQWLSRQHTCGKKCHESHWFG